MNFLDEVLSLVRAGGSLENLGRALARVLHHGRLCGFVFYAPSENCLVTVPYRSPDSVLRIRREFETRDWNGRPLEALLAAFRALEVPTGEVGEEVRWSLIGPEDAPLGIFACVRDPQAKPISEPEDKTLEFFLHLARHLAAFMAQPPSQAREARERERLLDAMGEIGRLMFERPARDRLLPALLRIALQAAQTEVGAILLWEEGRFRTEQECGLSGELLAAMRLVPGDQSPLDRLRETLEPVIIDDLSGPTVKNTSGIPVHVSSLVLLPLLAGDHLIGALGLASGVDGRDVSKTTLDALATVASLIAVAVENAKLGEALSAQAREAYRGLADEKNLLQRLLAGLQEGVLISDAGGRIALASPAAQEMLALGGETGGRRPERNVVTLRPFFGWLRERWLVNTMREEAEYILPTSPPALLALTISPLRAGDGGHVTVIRDVSEERVRDAARQDGAVRIAAEIEPALASLRAAFRLLAPQGIDLFEKIARRGIDRLAALAEDLRDHASLERGSLDIDTEDLAIEAVVEGAAATVRDVLTEKKIAYRALPPAGGASVRADRRYLARMLNRIFAAAARWTEEGGWIRPSIEWTWGVMEFSLAFLRGPEFPIETPVEPGTDVTRGVGAYDECNTLGLDVARRVAEQQGGRLAIQACGGREVKLVLELPASGPPAPDSRATEVSTKDGEKTPTQSA